jgi:peptide/nickel transport system permease protein
VSVIPVTLNFDTSTETAKRSAWLRSPKTVAGLVIFGAFVLMAIVGPFVAPYNPSATSTSFLSPPSLDHLLGTTAQGQDVLSQLLTGARYSMLVGIVAAGIGESLAIIVGITAGFMGGIVDEVLSTITNIFLVIPVLPLEIVLSGYLLNSGWLGITLIISLTAWPWGARTLRSQTLSIAKRDYIAAAKVAGDSNLRIVIFEILPNETAIIVTGLLFQVLFAVIVQTGLAFLGIGSLESWSWGGILYFAQNSDAFLANAWWWYAPPGLCLALVGLSLALINLGIDEIINPKLRVEHDSHKDARSRRATARRENVVTAEIVGGFDAGPNAAGPSDRDVSAENRRQG